MVKSEDVEKFLKDFKIKMKIWSVLFLDDRSKNFRALAELGIMASEREKVIADLEVNDYSEGPLKESMLGLNEMWVFGKVVKGNEVYIKICLGHPGTSTICISFHIAEFKMKYPYR